jgi:hypothetical protein
MRKRKLLSVVFILLGISFFLFIHAQEKSEELTDEQKMLQVLHSISSHTLFDYVKELASDKYEGRLTGTEGYTASADWVAGHFREWRIKSAGDNNTYLQAFPNPYTLIFEDCEVSLNIPVKDSFIKKYYTYEDEFIPGATSGSGEVTAEVIYVGYGITAPELGYD